MLSANSTLRELLWSFVTHRLRARYRGASLGVLWALLRPLATMLILSMVAFFFQLQSPYNVPFTGAFILVGLLPWLFTAGVISHASQVLLEESNVIKKVYFPRQVLPLAVTLAEGVHFLVALALLLPLLFLVCGFMPDGWFALLPLVIAIHLLFVYAFGLIVALGNVYYRDVSAILDAMLMAWFYLTPIFYPVSMVRDALQGADMPAWLLWVYMANPMAPLMYAYRYAVLHGAGLREDVAALPLTQTQMMLGLGWSLLFAVALWLLARHLYHRHDRHIADVI